MTKNIIGLQIVGSLCYVSVGLVKSIVWMSPIRTMDAFNHGRSHNENSLPQIATINSDASSFLPGTLTLHLSAARRVISATRRVIFTAWIPLIKRINLPIWPNATKTTKQSA
ncbi:hypothetical protein CN085_29330 [Sinorhizobium meliloti]|nr:hypothetical protein CN085_29330 [Sinorhizobium meliloti]